MTGDQKQLLEDLYKYLDDDYGDELSYAGIDPNEDIEQERLQLRERIRKEFLFEERHKLKT